jgi:TolB-like protein/DNA-binding winged helix-turn-helix (wHTH) protein
MTGSAAATGSIVFDAVEIDVAGRRLFVDGVETPLEPKAFAVLCLLANHPGRAFGRDEILDVVWGHRHITPGVLNRVITLIRQALGESASAHQYLHTLHGVGYRFDATIKTSLVAGDLSPPSVQAIVVSAATNTGVTPPASVAVIDSVAEHVPLPARTQATLSLGIFALLVVAALIAYFTLHHSAPVATNAAPVLVVLPLYPVGNTPGDTVLAEGLSEELITRLAHIEGLQLISRTSAARAQEDKFDLNQLSERLHVTHALEGSLRQSGDQLRIDLRLIEIPGGRTAWAQDFDRKFADVFSIQREIAQAVAQAMTLKLGLANAMTDAGADPQWFRNYLELRRKLWEPNNMPEHPELVDKLHALVARAPSYARAHGLLARALVQDLRATSVTDAVRAEAASEAAHALELDPDQIDAHVALASLAWRATDWPRCMEEYRRILNLDPTDSILRAIYAARLADLGCGEQALHQVEIGLISDPLNFESNYLRGFFLDMLGRHDEARQSLDATAELRADITPLLVSERMFNAVWRHDFAGAREFALSTPANSPYRDANIAVIDALIDPTRWPQAQAKLESSERVMGRDHFARLLQPNADSATQIAVLERISTLHTSPFGFLLWIPEFAALRQHPAFQDFLRRKHIIDHWRSYGWPPQCKPEGDGARCA